MLRTVVLSFSMTCGMCFISPAQAEREDSHTHHEAGETEIGFAVGYTRLKEGQEDDNGVNLHLHLLKRLEGEGIQEYLSVGFGVETILAEEDHYAAMLTLALHPWRNLVLSVSPGYEWAKHEGVWESGYMTHLEAAYLFEADGFHYGPVIGYSRQHDHDSEHYSIGLHVGMPL